MYLQIPVYILQKLATSKKKIDKTLQNVSISLTQQEGNLSTVIDMRWQHFPLIY